MHKVVPIYYSEYGRYISRFRAIPLFVDVLKPVERRLLLSLHEVAKKKFVKSAKVIGHVIGSYHPHGDQSAYGSLVDMVRRELVLGEGNFGVEGLEDDSPAAMRYTEVKANPRIEGLGFAYHKFVKWEDLELDPEPLYIPSPIPIGLIGFGAITGISFYTTTIPRYKFEDLVKRLIWLREDPEHNKVVPMNFNQELDPKIVGPIIQPDIRNCMVKEEEPNAFYKILKQGYGQVRIIPNGNIDKKKKMVSVLGKSPLRHGFNILARKCDGVDSKGNATKSGSIPGYLKDLTKESPHIAVFPEKPRSQDLNDLATQVWGVISPVINFNCQFSDFTGKIILMGIDDVLTLGYDSWVKAVLESKIVSCNKLFDKFFEAHIIYYIRQMDISKITNVNHVVKEFQKGTFADVNTDVYWPDKSEWRTYPRKIQEKDIREVCSKKSIRALLEVNVDINKIMADITDMKTSIDNNDQECFNTLKGLV